MRFTTIPLIILGCGLSGQASAQPQTPSPVSGQLQLVVTCPPGIMVGAIAERLPPGWLTVRETSYVFKSRSMDSVTMPGYHAPMMRCQYISGSPTVEEIAAYPPPSFPKCVVDANSTNKFVCTDLSVVTQYVHP